MTNHTNDIKTDDQFLMHDAIEDSRAEWIENEDGSGQWSDGWTGDDEFEPEYPSDDDAFFCYEDGDEWLGSGGSCETGDWIGPSDADPGL